LARRRHCHHCLHRYWGSCGCCCLAHLLHGRGVRDAKRDKEIVVEGLFLWCRVRYGWKVQVAWRASGVWSKGEQNWREMQRHDREHDNNEPS
jgi:hypothetical protein